MKVVQGKVDDNWVGTALVLSYQAGTLSEQDFEVRSEELNGLTWAKGRMLGLHYTPVDDCRSFRTAVSNKTFIDTASHVAHYMRHNYGLAFEEAFVEGIKEAYGADIAVLV